MNFVLKSNYTGEPEKVALITDEEIANQIVGSRVEFAKKHDVTVNYADGALMLDDVDMIIYIKPHEFFCYRGDDLIATFILEHRSFEIDLRQPGGIVNGRAFIRGIK